MEREREGGRETVKDFIQMDRFEPKRLTSATRIATCAVKVSYFEISSISRFGGIYLRHP